MGAICDGQLASPRERAPMMLSFAPHAAAIIFCAAMSRVFERIAERLGTNLVLSAGTNLHLAVLVPSANSWPEGRASIGAISLAIDVVNAKAQDALHGSMIRGRKITYSWRELDCDRSKALAALSQILEEGPVDAVIGPDCSAACESTAILTSASELPQISYSCSSAALSDKTTYPTVRLAPRPRVRVRLAPRPRVRVTETLCIVLAARPYL